MRTKNPAYILQRMYVGFIFMKQLGSLSTMPEWLNVRNVLTVVFLLAMFFVGRAIAYATTPTAGVVAQTENWGLGFGEKGTQPTGNESAETTLNFLLERFVGAAILYDTQEYKTDVQKKMMALVSDNYKAIYKIYSEGKSEEEKLYLRLLLVTDSICGMTDSYAKRLYQELSGIL